jgi:hypothetical protein
MAEFRFGLILLLALASVQTGRTQTGPFPSAQNYNFGPTTSAKPTCAECAVNKVYSLADLGEDPNLCKWIAETIPQMIKPGCWTGKNLCYYAPAKVMAIHQTPEVHAKVEEFLANMRKSLPRDKTTANRPAHDPQVAPAQFNPEPLRPADPASASQPYPLPAPLQAPKHLFHFIIRYEGAGIIDSNVTKFTEALTKGATGFGIQSSSDPQNLAVPTGVAPTTWMNAVPVGNAYQMMPTAEGAMPHGLVPNVQPAGSNSQPFPCPLPPASPTSPPTVRRGNTSY